MPPILGLDYAANTMFRSLIKGSSSADKKIGQFFNLANNSNLQGQALVSYYSQAREIGKIFPGASHEVLNNAVMTRIYSNEELQNSADVFVKELNKSYPKTLQDRIALASHGCVESGTVKPQSKFKKFLVSVSKMIRED